MTYVALFRGINVGGKNKIKMKDLAATLEGAGLLNVTTYVQSGNVVYDLPQGTGSSAAPTAADLAARIRTAVADSHGIEPDVLVLSAETFIAVAGANPFPDATEHPKTLHVFFLKEPPQAPDTAKLQSLKSASERFVLTDRAFFLHAPEGFGFSKLGMGAERALGVSVTARNWRTVEHLLTLLRERKGATT